MRAGCTELHRQLVLARHSATKPLFLKESLTFYRPVLKWGVGRMLPGTVGLEENSLSESGKLLGFFSLFTVMEILSVT